MHNCGNNDEFIRFINIKMGYCKEILWCEQYEPIYNACNFNVKIAQYQDETRRRSCGYFLSLFWLGQLIILLIPFESVS